MTPEHKRVCLLFPQFYEGFVMRKVPLGLASLATYLRDAGHQVQAYNLNVDPLEQIDFAAFDVVGITCLTPFLTAVRHLCDHIRRQHPAVTIVVGGPHPTYRPETVFDDLPLIDFAVAGEGEIAFAKLVSAPDHWRQIGGVYARTASGAVAGTAPAPLDIHALKYPDRRLFDHGHLEKRNPFRAVLASRGCPFRCFNCQPILNQVQPFRLRTPEDVYQEIRYLYLTYDQTYFGFLDSEFPLKKSWLDTFFGLVKRSGMPFSFHCNARSDLLDEDILQWFKEFNITRLAIGVESGSQRVINDVLHKNIRLDDTFEIFRAARRIGVTTHGHFMIGIPGETMKEMEQTYAFAFRLPAHSIEFNMLTPWPGTHFWRICRDNGYLTDTDTAHWNEKRLSFVSTPEFTNQDVMSFYQTIRSRLTDMGWSNSSDGSVYFRPEAN